MNIDAIHLYSAGESTEDPVQWAELGLSGVDMTHSFILEQAWGLDLDEIGPQYYGNYGDDKFYDMVLPARTVVLKIKLNPQPSLGESVEQMRNDLSRMISYSRTSLVDIRFVFDSDPIGYLRGFVRKYETDIFTSNPTVQVTIECPDPLIKAYYPIELAGTDDVIVPYPLLIDQVSTAPHGFKMQLTFSGTVAAPFIIQGKYGTTEWPFRIDMPSSFVSGDVLWFSSEMHDRYLYRVRSGVTLHLIDAIALNQVWPMIFPNPYYNTQIGFSSSSLSITSLTHYESWWGI